MTSKDKPFTATDAQQQTADYWVRFGALAKLRELLKPGDTVLCIQRHTSRSGASRSVSLFAGNPPAALDADVALALGLQLDRKHGGIRVYPTSDGVTVDAGAAIVSQLSVAIGKPLRHRMM